MSRLVLAALVGALSIPCGAAFAEPGLASVVYGPSVSRGETELELRGGVLNGGAANGDWQVKAEASHAFTDFWRVGVVGEWEQEDGATDFTAHSVENVFDVTGTRAWPVHLGAYAEYEWKNDGADVLELKLLMQRRRGPLDLALNLVSEREVGAGAGNGWEFGYAARAAYALNDDLELGVEGFGDAGTDDDFGSLGDQAHYWGPIAQFEVAHAGDGEVEMQIGYLAGFGEADADGQLRVKLEYEFGGMR